MVSLTDTSYAPRSIRRALSSATRDEGAGGEARAEQRLAHAADGAGGQHRLDATDYIVHVDTAATRDFAERVGMKAREPVFGHGEDAAVGFVMDAGGRGSFEHAAAAPD